MMDVNFFRRHIFHSKHLVKNHHPPPWRNLSRKRVFNANNAMDSPTDSPRPEDSDKQLLTERKPAFTSA